MKLNLVTPHKKIHTEVEVDEVIVPAYMGQLDILPGHAPLMTTLSTGILKYRLKGESQFQKAAISWGYLEVSPTEINVLAETAETEEDLDENRIHVAFKKSQERLTDMNLEMEMVEKYQRKLRRATTRLELIKKQ